MLRPIKLIFIKNYNFNSNLKICHCVPKMGVWFIDYSDERIGDKKLQFTGIERWHLYKNETKQKYSDQFARLQRYMEDFEKTLFCNINPSVSRRRRYVGGYFECFSNILMSSITIDSSNDVQSFRSLIVNHVTKNLNSAENFTRVYHNNFGILRTIHLILIN